MSENVIDVRTAAKRYYYEVVDNSTRADRVLDKAVSMANRADVDRELIKMNKTNASKEKLKTWSDAAEANMDRALAVFSLSEDIRRGKGGPATRRLPNLNTRKVKRIKR